MTPRSYCRHTITDNHGHDVTCRRGLAHDGDHTAWSPDRSRIEWDSSGMVLANVGTFHPYRRFKPGRRYVIVAEPKR